MSFKEVVRFALRGLSANKLRSALTMLGILIGVASVILLVAVGNGSAKAISARIEALGTNTITVMSTNRGGSASTALTTEMADAMTDPTMAPDVKSVSPVVSSSATITYEGTDHSVNSFVGTTPGWFSASNTPVGTGSGFTADDEAQGRRVVVLGQTVVEELFPGVDPIDKQVTVGGALFTVVGVLKEKSSTGFQDANDTAVAPLSAVRQVLTGYGALNSILVEAKDPNKVDTVETEVSTILDQRLTTTASSSTSSSSTPYRIQNASQLLETQTATAATFTTLLGAVAAISLLVGGIGITNIMLVTVTERTREIGIRKALGAQRIDILSQFLTEAVLLSLLGGTMCVAIGIGVAHLQVGPLHLVGSFGSIVLSFGVSALVGIFFGFYPANRAARLTPIEALRYE